MFTKKLLVFSTFLALLISSLLNFPVAAQDSGVSLFPGQTKTFTVSYENGGDVAQINNALLRIFIGNKLEVDPASFTDQFDNGTIFSVCSTIIRANPGVWGTVLEYRPRSATNTSACSGVNTAGPVTMAPSSNPGAVTGKFSFSARLRTNVTDAPGTVLRYDVGEAIYQGIYTELRLDDSNVNANFPILVAQAPTSELIDADIPGLTVVCTEALVNSTTTCTFLLPTNKTLPVAGINMRIGDSTTKSDVCVITTAQNVTCNRTPTGSQPGLQIIFGSIGTNPKVDTGEKVNILTDVTELTDADIPGLNLICDEAFVNTTTICRFVLPSKKILPARGLNMSIGNATAKSDLCVITTGQNVSCNRTPTGSQSGLQIIFGSIGTNPKVDTGEKVRINDIPLPPTPRTGGPEFLAMAAILAAGSAVGIYYLTRQRRLRVN